MTTSDRIPLIRARILLADGTEASLLEADQILQRTARVLRETHTCGIDVLKC